MSSLSSEGILLCYFKRIDWHSFDSNHWGLMFQYFVGCCPGCVALNRTICLIVFNKSVFIMLWKMLQLLYDFCWQLREFLYICRLLFVRVCTHLIYYRFVKIFNFLVHYHFILNYQYHPGYQISHNCMFHRWFVNLVSWELFVVSVLDVSSFELHNVVDFLS